MTGPLMRFACSLPGRDKANTVTVLSILCIVEMIFIDRKPYKMPIHINLYDN